MQDFLCEWIKYVSLRASLRGNGTSTFLKIAIHCSYWILLVHCLVAYDIVYKAVNFVKKETWAHLK